MTQRTNRYSPRSSSDRALRRFFRWWSWGAKDDERARSALADARDQLTEGSADAALDTVHAVLASPIDVAVRAIALEILGDCAESDGDFVVAADLYAEARTAHLWANERTWITPRDLHRALAVLDAKRAFAFAAAGRLEDAEQVARNGRRSDDVAALTQRALALIHFKRGEHDKALAACGNVDVARSPIVGPRNAALLRAIARSSQAALTAPYRGDGVDVHSEDDLDDETKRWIESVLGR